MDFLVISDTHGRGDRLAAVLARTHADVLFFLGDGLRDLAGVADAPGLPPTVRAVRGNCDFFGSHDTPETRVEDFGATRFFLTHGHRFGVKYSTEALAAAAAAAGADVALYGHTHTRYTATIPAGTVLGGVRLVKPLLLLCPGSLGEPRDGAPGFATVTVRQNGILAGFGELT